MTTLKITRQGEQKRSYSIIILQLSFRNLFAISRTYIIFRFHTIFFSLSLSLPPSPARWLGFVVVHITTELHGKFLLFFSIYNISFYALSLFFFFSRCYLHIIRSLFVACALLLVTLAHEFLASVPYPIAHVDFVIRMMVKPLFAPSCSCIILLP